MHVYLRDDNKKTCHIERRTSRSVNQNNIKKLYNLLLSDKTEMIMYHA